jgi:hypothetical protein
MNRLLRIGGIARNNNPQVFERFMNEEVEPVLRNRLARNPNHLNSITQTGTILNGDCYFYNLTILYLFMLFK